MDKVKNLGQVMTPINIVDYMIDNILCLSKEQLTNFLFLDNSCGDGSFVKGLIARGVPVEHIYACDIDEEIEENTENSSNILDITDVLWQNILLEVPLKLTNVKSFDEYHGDGWKLISEDSIENTNNPFKELEEILREE